MNNKENNNIMNNHNIYSINNNEHVAIIITSHYLSPLLCAQKEGALFLQPLLIMNKA